MYDIQCSTVERAHVRGDRPSRYRVQEKQLSAQSCNQIATQDTGPTTSFGAGVGGSGGRQEMFEIPARVRLETHYAQHAGPGHIFCSRGEIVPTDAARRKRH